MFDTEFEFQKALYRYFRRHRDGKPILEAPALAKSIDLVYLTEEDTLQAWELKLHGQYQRAYVQARGNLMVCDYSYVCLPYEPSSAGVRFFDRRNRVGLQWYDHQNQQIVLLSSATKSTEKFEPMENRLRRYIQHFWEHGRRP